MEERCIPEELPAHAPFWDPVVTLGFIVDGRFLSGNNKGDKAYLLSLTTKPVMAVAAWHGQRRSDIFTVPEERLKQEAQSADYKRNAPREYGLQ